VRQIKREVLIEQLLPIARAAGGVIMALYEADATHVQHKADASPVTEADLAAHHVLAAQLAALLLGSIPAVLLGSMLAGKISGRRVESACMKGDRFMPPPFILSCEPLAPVF
jgi:3'-phosphoadenosine 5'-phosphosulfate (PAPS) 3'-phosphatase